MMKKLTITVSEEVYNGLYAKIGAGKISGFIDSLLRRNILEDELRKGYKTMGADRDREEDAERWTAAFLNEDTDETW
jgi:hypothetical protein